MSRFIYSHWRCCCIYAGLCTELASIRGFLRYGLILAFDSRITAASLQETLLPFNTMTTITVFLLFGIAMDPARLLPSLSEGWSQPQA